MPTCSFVLVFALVSSAYADPPVVGDETIVIIDHAPDPAAARDRDRALGDAPFVTVIHPDDHPATASVADAVGATVGAQTRSLGGLGAFESVAIRGASPGHTAVLIDGVPLARIAQVTTDLGRFSLDAFGEVDLYRGAVPVELGGAGVGGALNLITRLGPGDGGDTIRASVGGGSYGARHARVHYGDAHGDWLSSTTLGYQGATGDYSYFYDGGTPLNRSDDSYQIRRNNGFDQVDGATRWGRADGGVVGGLRAAYKHQGLPGSVANPTMDSSLTTVDVIGDARGDHQIGAASERELGYLLVEGQRLHDPRGELGLGSEQRAYTTLSGGATSTWIVAVGDHRLTGGVEARADDFHDRDTTGKQPTESGERLGGALALAADLALDSTITITPAVRLDVVRTAPAPATVGPAALMPVPTRWDVVPSPRLTARLLASEDLAIKASGGWYVRLPTLIEMFGDRGYILGSPDLRPERGPSADFGGVWAPAKALGPIDRVMATADVFATRAHDTIAFITTAGYVARATNIGDSETYGAELVGSARIARTLSLTASYTRLHTAQISPDVNLDGKPLPREPDDLLYARADVVHALAGRASSAWLDTAWQSDSFLDNASLGRVPGRVLIGAGARVEVVTRVGVAVAVENLADVRVVQLPLDPPPSPTFTSTPAALTDVAGFPLPGRSLYVSLDWSH